MGILWCLLVERLAFVCGVRDVGAVAIECWCSGFPITTVGNNGMDSPFQNGIAYVKLPECIGHQDFIQRRRRIKK
jgi:hypothetical protein